MSQKITVKFLSSKDCFYESSYEPNDFLIKNVLNYDFYISSSNNGNGNQEIQPFVHTWFQRSGTWVPMTPTLLDYDVYNVPTVVCTTDLIIPYPYNNTSITLWNTHGWDTSTDTNFLNQIKTWLLYNYPFRNMENIYIAYCRTTSSDTHIDISMRDNIIMFIWEGDVGDLTL